MLRLCAKHKTQMVKIKRSQVINLANPWSKVPEPSDWWVCQYQDCNYEEKA